MLSKEIIENIIIACSMDIRYIPTRNDYVIMSGVKKLPSVNTVKKYFGNWKSMTEYIFSSEEFDSMKKHPKYKFFVGDGENYTLEMEQNIFLNTFKEYLDTISYLQGRYFLINATEIGNVYYDKNNKFAIILPYRYYHSYYDECERVTNDWRALGYRIAIINNYRKFKPLLKKLVRQNVM
jgi:hypothetical protein